jgi:hypothetical protein
VLAWSATLRGPSLLAPPHSASSLQRIFASRCACSDGTLTCICVPFCPCSLTHALTLPACTHAHFLNAYGHAHSQSHALHSFQPFLMHITFSKRVTRTLTIARAPLTPWHHSCTHPLAQMVDFDTHAWQVATETEACRKARPEWTLCLQCTPRPR